MTDTVKREDVLALVERHFNSASKSYREADGEREAYWHGVLAALGVMQNDIEALPPAGDGEVERLREALRFLREVAHCAYHVLEASEESEIRDCVGSENVNDLEQALQSFIDKFDPEGPGSTDAHDACFAIDNIIAGGSGVR